MRVRKCADDVVSGRIKNPADKTRAASGSDWGSASSPLIANTVIKRCQKGDHRRRTVPELSQLPFRAVEIL